MVFSVHTKRNSVWDTLTERYPSLYFLVIFIQNKESTCEFPFLVAHKTSRDAVQAKYEVVQTCRLIRLTQEVQLTYICINVCKVKNRLSYRTSYSAVGKFVCYVTECSFSPPSFITKELQFSLPELSVEKFIIKFCNEFDGKFEFPVMRVLENKTYPLRAGIQTESWQLRC